MPKTRTSNILEKAQKRKLALQSIDPNLSISSGISVAEFSVSIDDTQAKVDRYNLAIATLTQLYSEMMASEKFLADHHERMLNGVSSQFGRNSTEYEMAGGRKRSGKRKTKVTSPTMEMPLAKSAGMGIVTLPAASAQSSAPAQLAVNAMMN
jgi:hypothetical protein